MKRGPIGVLDFDILGTTFEICFSIQNRVQWLCD